MSAHGRGGVAHRSAELNAEPLERVGVVARPDLRRIIEHTRVEASAAARAILKQHIGERLGQAIHDLICAEHEAVSDLLLPLGGQRRRADLAEITVEIPLEVIDLVGREHLIHLVEDIVADILAAEVKDVLMPCDGFLSAGHMDAPVGMRPVKVAVA